MKFDELDEVIYIDENDQKVYTFIKKVDVNKKLYLLDENQIWVSEDEVTGNTENIFSVPNELVKASLFAMRLRIKIQKVKIELAKLIEDEYMDVSSDMNGIVVTVTPTVPFSDDDKTKIKMRIMNLVRSVLKKINSDLEGEMTVVIRYLYYTHHTETFSV